MTQAPSCHLAKHQAKDVSSLIWSLVSVYLEKKKVSVLLRKLNSDISLSICLWQTWNEQKGEYGLSWHQFDIAAAPFCPATDRLVFMRSCQLKSSVTCWLLTCHFASPTQTAAHKCPPPCIYPKACLSLPPPFSLLSAPESWQKQKRSSRLRVSSWIVLQMETITYFWTICAVSLLFSDVRRGCVAAEINQVLLSLWLLRFVLTQTNRRFSEASHIC